MKILSLYKACYVKNHLLLNDDGYTIAKFYHIISSATTEKILYDSDKVFHTKEICGDILKSNEFENEINIIANWAHKVGYDIYD